LTNVQEQFGEGEVKEWAKREWPRSQSNMRVTLCGGLVDAGEGKGVE